MSETVLKVNNLQVKFSSDESLITAVDDISFEVESGKTLGIVGESGSGKSVTSLAVLGLLPSSSSKVSGEVWFRKAIAEGETSEAIDLLQLPEAKKVQYRGGEISMIFQEPMSSLNPVYTIGFQLTEAIRLHRDVSAPEARRVAASLLQEVKLLPDDEELRSRVLQEASLAQKGEGNLSDREIMQKVNGQKLAMLERYPHQLSGGQLQRVTIAMAISCNPTLLIADEPTTALDVTVQATILELMRELRSRRGMSMMFISHDLAVIAEIADVVAVMYQGKIVEKGNIAEIFSNPQHPYTKGLLACRPPLDRQVERLATVSDFMELVTNASGVLEIREKVREERETSVVEEPREEMPVVETQTKTQEPSVTSAFDTIAKKSILKVENLQVGFPVKGMFGRTKRLFMAVNDVSFEVKPGETLGLVGESGCGKSTLARAILQLIPPTGGRVFFEGEEIKKGKKYDRKLRWLRRDLQIIFQDPFSSLNPRLTVGAAVMEPMLIHGVLNSSKERRDRSVYLLERVGLNAEALNRYPHEFSGGQRQRVCIARALALNPKFVICDESVSALDVSVQAQVLNLLKELQGEFGLTYIFISHDLSVVKFMSDRIMVMNRGKIEEIDGAEEIYQRPKTEYTRKLIASIPTGNLERVRVS
ncbi:MAG: ABC transporter ATP-binding protein [Cyanobacteriota bacterium]|nr:ABC transporter ATP-binding protein [Cyanobacteriota bacterium]